MGKLLDTIRSLVVTGRYVVSVHASERLDEREMLEWQVVDGITSATLREERPDDLPNPSIVLEQILPDGTIIVAVWSHIILGDFAKLVTIYFLDR